jgi:hypothetical protein
MFPGNDLHWRIYYADRQWKSIFTGGLQLPVCKNDDFYWPLALAVTINATKNKFTTVTIELFCTSGAARLNFYSQRRHAHMRKKPVHTRNASARMRHCFQQSVHADA